MYKKTNKIMASLIVFIMLLANFSPIAQVIAADGLNAQNNQTNNANVEFDSYFVEKNKKAYEATKNIGEDNKVVAQISVKEAGYLKDARIEFADSNFKINETDSEVVSNIDNNVLTLNQINCDENVVIELPISFEHGEQINLAEFNKESIVKFTAKYVDGKGKERNIHKNINLNLKWTANTEVEINSQVSKYLPFDVKGQKGLILQTLLTENVKDNILPIKTSNIEIQVPNINGVYPTKVTVYSLTNMEYTFDKENNKLTIITNNDANEQNEITWTNEATREYVITYTYPEKAISENEVEVNLNATSKLQLYSADNNMLETKYEQKETLKDNVGKIIDFKLTTTEMISKGYINANFDREEKLETLYNEKAIIDINMPELFNGITLNMKPDSYTKEEKAYAGNSSYKSFKVSKAKFVEYFGEDVTIEIYSNNQIIKGLNAKVDAEELTAELDNDNITIVTSKPIKAGQIAFEFEKAVNKDTTYTIEQIKELDGIKEEANLIVKDGEETIVDYTQEAKVAMVDTLLQGELSMNNNNLSTVVTNENVEIRVVLKTASEYNKLFKNPVVELTLPSYIENIDIKDIQILFDDELTIKNYHLDGNKIIVELDGVQTNYNIGSIYGGTNIVINTDLTVNKLTPNKTEMMTMSIISNNEQITAYLDINFIAPSGVVALNKITNNSDGREVLAYTEDESAVIAVRTEAKQATEEIRIINNYDNKIENIEILGRTLATDTTTTNGQVSLNNNLDIPMTGAINNEENAQVYYSTNGKATKDLNNTENGWTTTPEDFTNIKSYLIVMDENTELDSGDSISFSYDMQIPENLHYSLSTSSLYTVYFDNVQEEQTINDQVTSRMLTLGTGVAPDLNVTLSSNFEENSTVYVGEYIKYTATIQNIGNVDAENVVLNATAPSIKNNGSIFTTKHAIFKEENFFYGYEESEDIERSIEVGTIKAGEQANIDFEIKVADVEQIDLENNSNTSINNIEESEFIKVKARVIADKMQGEIESNEYKLKAEIGNLSLFLGSSVTTDSVLIKGKELTYSLRLTNYISDDINNVSVKANIPNGLNIEEVTIRETTSSEDSTPEGVTSTINENTNLVTINIETFKGGTELLCDVKTTVGDAIGTISPYFEVIENNNKYIANTISNKVDKLNFTIRQNSPDSNYVKESETITFEYVVTNTSKVYSSDFTLENIIPDGMKIVSVQTVIGDDSIETREQEKDGKLTISRTFKAEQTIIFRITMRAQLLPTGTTQKQITNYAKIYATGFDAIESNRINATIEYNENAYRGYEPTPEDPNNPDNPYNPKGKKIISGLAWIDKNQDGERNEDEELLSGIEVRLYNADNNELVKTTETLSNGEYLFTELDNGDYIVVFVFDKAKYDLTTYRKQGVSQSTNSDVIEVDMEIDEVTRKVAITDIIRLTDSNMRNVDIGLIEANKSDLKLEKYISSVTVSYGDTVKTYDYEDAKLAKVEIPVKYLENATVIVNYKFVITNEGAISNYVKKIVDYVPSGMKFNSELNKDWYQSSNSDIYNSSLANIKLEPGQSKEISLTLTKQMTSENTGLVNNNAEIYEVYNEEGINDYDSTPGNKVNSEDDISSADIVIGIKTGDAVIYTLIISTIICIIIGLSAYYIRKSILKRI